MSILAMNWALSQRLETSQQQALLYVIADSADANGITRHCDPEYMSARARMSRATMFRRLADLERYGILQRFKSYSDRGVPIYEIRLDLSAHICLPLRGRRTDDDEEAPDGAESQVETGPKSQSETGAKSQGETGKVSAVRQPESHSGDSIIPTVIQEITPNPLRGGNGGRFDLDGLSEFKLDYPKTGTWVWSKAEPLWAALSPDERIRCRASVLLYAKQTARDKPPPRRPDVWLRERMWENYPAAKLPDVQSAPPPRRVWIAEKDLESLDFAMRICGRGKAPRVRDDERGIGIWRNGHLEADLIALELFIDSDRAAWVQLDEGTQEFGAWFSWLKNWTGFPPELNRIPVGPHLPEHDLERWDPRFKLRKMINVLRVPCRWPPRKNGTFLDEGEGE